MRTRDLRYLIHENVAWDYVPETPQLSALAPTLDAICFGTLAQRSPVTRATLRSLVAATRADCLRVFDVNLREPDWTAEAVAVGLRARNHSENESGRSPAHCPDGRCDEPSKRLCRLRVFCSTNFPSRWLRSRVVSRAACW